MFEVFEDMKKGKYVRNTVVTNTKPSKHQLQKIEGPLEMNGKQYIQSFFALFLYLYTNFCSWNFSGDKSPFCGPTGSFIFWTSEDFTYVSGWMYHYLGSSRIMILGVNSDGQTGEQISYLFSAKWECYCCTMPASYLYPKFSNFLACTQRCPYSS